MTADRCSPRLLSQHVYIISFLLVEEDRKIIVHGEWVGIWQGSVPRQEVACFGKETAGTEALPRKCDQGSSPGEGTCVSQSNCAFHLQLFRNLLAPLCTHFTAVQSSCLASRRHYSQTNLAADIERFSFCSSYSRTINSNRRTASRQPLR